MSLKNQRIQEVYTCFKHNDVELGYRKLMDCAIDTQNLSIYQHIIGLTQWKANNPNQIEAFVTQCIDVLKLIETSKITIHEDYSAVITAQNITKRYGKNGFSLGPVSLSIKKGQVYGLVGENGNGKTTLLRILAKELNFDKGSIEYTFNKPYT